MAHSISYIDFILWGVVAFGVQIATFFGLKLFLRRQGESLSQHITEGHQAYGTLVGSISITVPDVCYKEGRPVAIFWPLRYSKRQSTGCNYTL